MRGPAHQRRLRRDRDQHGYWRVFGHYAAGSNLRGPHGHLVQISGGGHCRQKSTNSVPSLRSPLWGRALASCVYDGVTHTTESFTPTPQKGTAIEFGTHSAQAFLKPEFNPDLVSKPLTFAVGMVSGYEGITCTRTGGPGNGNAVVAQIAQALGSGVPTISFNRTDIVGFKTTSDAI